MPTTTNTRQRQGTNISLLAERHTDLVWCTYLGDNLLSLIETVELTSNHFDSTAADDGYYVNPNNGALAANTSYATTGFIPVSPGEVITYQYGTLTVEQGRTIGNMPFLACVQQKRRVFVWWQRCYLLYSA